MKPQLKKIIIFIVILVILIFLFIFVSKKSPDTIPNLSSSSNSSTASNDAGGIADDFLAWLLSVKSITLNDSIFSDPAFISLQDSSILLTPDGTEGRPNPFAPIGVDITSVTLSNTTSVVPNVQTQTDGATLPIKKPVTSKTVN
jgi:hypothetical protein